MRLFPVIDKKPVFPGWQTQATASIDALEAWEAAYPGCDFARPTGKDEGFFVLDVDKKNGVNGYEHLEALGVSTEGPNAIPTRSGGMHIYYRWPHEGYVPQKVGFRPGLDTRANGGYVVAYDADLGLELDMLPPAPKELLEALAERKTAIATLVEPGNVMEGGRNHYLTQAAGRLQRANLLTLEALLSINERDCHPPVAEAEVASIVASVSRYAPSDPLVVEKPQGLLWAKDLLTPMMNYLQDKDLVKGEPTGLEAMDTLLGGGKRLGELDVTVGSGKTGKNTLWHQLLLTWLNKGIPIAYASRELSPETEVLPNLLTIFFKQNMLKAKTYDMKAIEAALAKWRLAFSPGYGSFPPEEMLPWMDQCREVGVKHFFIDHLHYCLDDPEDFKMISNFIRKLKAYCKEHLVHIDLIVQPKVTQPGERLSLNSMRGGASIGQALDNLWTLQRVRDEKGDSTNVMEVRLEAARSKMARLGTFYLEYNTETMSFREVIPVVDNEGQESVGAYGKRVE